MKTHYDPFSDDDVEQAPCGTWLGETSSVTGDWGRVTCGHCISKKRRINSSIKADEKVIVTQLGDMADLMTTQGIQLRF